MAAGNWSPKYSTQSLLLARAALTAPEIRAHHRAIAKLSARGTGFLHPAQTDPILSPKNIVEVAIGNTCCHSLKELGKMPEAREALTKQIQLAGFGVIHERLELSHKWQHPHEKGLIPIEFEQAHNFGVYFTGGGHLVSCQGCGH